MFGNDFAKMVATVAMWIVLGLVSILVVAGAAVGLRDSDILPLTLVPLGMALAGTIAIWTTHPEETSRRDKSATAEASEKAKRSGRLPREDRLALLLEMMDEDERQAFKEVLKQQVLRDTGYDGELPYSNETLAALLDEENQRHQRR